MSQVNFSGGRGAPRLSAVMNSARGGGVGNPTISPTPTIQSQYSTGIPGMGLHSQGAAYSQVTQAGDTLLEKMGLSLAYGAATATGIFFMSVAGFLISAATKGGN